MFGHTDIGELYNTCKKRKKYLLLIVAFPLVLISSLFGKREYGRIETSKAKPLNAKDVGINFVSNMKHISAICNSRGIAFYSILQPINGIGNGVLTKEDRILISPYKNSMVRDTYSKLDFIKEVFDTIKAESKEDKYFRDFTGVFDKEKGQIFFDTCHFSDKGQKIVARTLFDLIKEEHIK